MYKNTYVLSDSYGPLNVPENDITLDRFKNLYNDSYDENNRFLLGGI